MTIQAKKEALLTLSQKVLDEAKKQGATSAAAGISTGDGLSVDVRMAEIDKLEYHRDQGLGVTVYFGQRQGTASTGDLSDAAISDTVRAACNIAKYTSEDECRGLADAELMATEFPDLDLYHPWDITAEQAIEKAIACENAAREFDPRITNSDGASVSTYSGLSAYANSHGFAAVRASSSHSLSCSVIANEADGDGMQRDYWYDSSRIGSQLDSPEIVGQKAAEETLSRLDARKLTSRQCPVLYIPRLASGLLGHFTSAIGGSAQYRKASYLLDSVGSKVFPDFVNLYERPFIPQGMRSASYDSEGVATREQDIVRDGIVQTYIMGSYSARKLGLQSTGNSGGLHNLTVDSTGQGFAEMLRLMDTGLLLTGLIGSGINGITGDYSRGATGFWVEKGVIQYPVEEITIAGNLKDMLGGIVAIGNDTDRRIGTRTGSILVEQMMISGE
ncbi:metalloprotease PmbA [Leucothrix pacifica]|uniref:Metalloprotease PmbA n=1 Tax=Leucothrix pacifica TaxID=1247513 RepID=A0A317CI78_9GAMM|nr:metalloprotease PmbA [Leucothrix pacifica]PWQ98206.1 metalloprotease PmbA [Leucothrix pacifica]